MHISIQASAWATVNVNDDICRSILVKSWENSPHSFGKRGPLLTFVIHCEPVFWQPPGKKVAVYIIYIIIDIYIYSQI